MPPPLRLSKEVVRLNAKRPAAKSAQRREKAAVAPAFRRLLSALTPRQGRISSPPTPASPPTAVSLSTQPAWFAASAATTPSLEPLPSASPRTAVSLSFGRKKEKVRRKEKESRGLRIRRKRRRRPHLRCGKAPSYFAYHCRQPPPAMPTGRPCTFIGRVWFPTLRAFLKRCMPP